jgi:L-alanine-DL-glutamate epimerase-like enolase superfamily enzyme
MIKKTRELGLAIMVGCMSETTIGMSAAVQLLPFVDYADLDGPLLLAEDLATGLKYSNGEIGLSGDPGLGISYTGKQEN